MAEQLFLVARKMQTNLYTQKALCKIYVDHFKDWKDWLVIDQRHFAKFMLIISRIGKTDWLLDALMSKQYASVFLRQIFSECCTCCHTEMELISISYSLRILTPGQPVPALTL